MKRICINSRDELFVIPLDKVMYVEANGNYSNVTFVEGHKMMLSIGLSKVETIISAAFGSGVASPFIRLGRSLIINQTFLSSINLLRQQLVLSDYGKNKVVISVHKQLLKDYKELVKTEYAKRLCQQK